METKIKELFEKESKDLTKEEILKMIDDPCCKSLTENLIKVVKILVEKLL